MCHLRDAGASLMSFLLVTPVAGSEGVPQPVSYDLGLDCQLQVEVLPTVNELLSEHSDFFHQVLEQPMQQKIIRLYDQEFDRTSSKKNACNIRNAPL